MSGNMVFDVFDLLAQNKLWEHIVKWQQWAYPWKLTGPCSSI